MSWWQKWQSGGIHNSKSLDTEDSRFRIDHRHAVIDLPHFTCSSQYLQLVYTKTETHK